MLTHPDLERAQAAQCRRLAEVIIDHSVRKRLLKMAKELEGEASQRLTGDPRRRWIGLSG